MAIFEQRRSFDPKEMAKKAGLKFNPKNNIAFLENTGNEADLLRQRNVYYQEHYEEIGRTEMGIFMECSQEQSRANEARMAKESSDRLKRKPSAAGLPDEQREENTIETAPATSAADFLDTDE